MGKIVSETVFLLIVNISNKMKYINIYVHIYSVKIEGRESHPFTPKMDKNHIRFGGFTKAFFSHPNGSYIYDETKYVVLIFMILENSQNLQFYCLCHMYYIYITCW